MEFAKLCNISGIVSPPFPPFATLEKSRQTQTRAIAGSALVWLFLSRPAATRRISFATLGAPLPVRFLLMPATQR